MTNSNKESNKLDYIITVKIEKLKRQYEIDTVVWLACSIGCREN